MMSSIRRQSTQSLRRVFDPTPMILRQFSLLIHSSAIARLQIATGAYLLRLGYHTQRRYAAITCGAPIQRESRPLSLITAILSGCFRASACAARRTEPVCARVGGKEL